jgi:hypothetical protein
MKEKVYSVFFLNEKKALHVYTGCINFTEVNAGCDPCLKINKANNCKASIGELLLILILILKKYFI